MNARYNAVQDLFLKLVRVDGVSHHERAVADEVTRILEQAGVAIVEDGTAASIGGNAGNLLCFPPGFRRDTPAIILTAHLDTVQSTKQCLPQVHDGRITSDGTTILGADNRLGLSILIRLLLDITEQNLPHKNFFTVFTVGEETGLYGAGLFNPRPWQVTGAYVFDCSKRPGTYIRESVGLHMFTVRVVGKSAHSGVAPEEGINAISLAASAVSKLSLGRLDAETTANIGLIKGGEAVNAVPENVILEGEVRSFQPERIREELQRIERIFRESIPPPARVEFSSAPDFEPYTLEPSLPLLQDLEKALREVGLEPHPIRYTGGSDANKYNANKIPAVNIGIGAQKPHSHEEFVLIEDLHKSYDLAHALIRE